MKMMALDFDGTLVDSTQRHRILLDDILKEKQIKLDTSDLMEFKALGNSNKAYLQMKHISQAEEICAEWIKKIETPAYLKYDVLYPYTVPFLKRAQAQNAKLYLLTARTNANALLGQLKDFEIAPFFDEVFIVNTGKTAAQAKAEYLKRICATLFIGDTESDKEAADLANVPFAALNRGFRNKAFWGKNNIKSFNNLQEIP